MAPSRMLEVSNLSKQSEPVASHRKKKLVLTWTPWTPHKTWWTKEHLSVEAHLESHWDEIEMHSSDVTWGLAEAVAGWKKLSRFHFTWQQYNQPNQPPTKPTNQPNQPKNCWWFTKKTRWQFRNFGIVSENHVNHLGRLEYSTSTKTERTGKLYSQITLLGWLLPVPPI